MADFWELEDGSGVWELEDASGNWLLELFISDTVTRTLAVIATGFIRIVKGIGLEREVIAIAQEEGELL